MCGFQDTLDNLFPKSWLDPYGKMPMNPGLQTSIDITVEKSDGFTKVTAVKTPPRSQHMSFQDVLEMALSITSCESGPLCKSPQTADLGKQECEKDDKEPKEKPDTKPSGEDTPEDGEDIGKKKKPW